MTVRIMGVKQKLSEVRADQAYWHKFADAFGWHLDGFTFRRVADFITDEHGPLLEITGKQRDTIMAALAARKPNHG